MLVFQFFALGFPPLALALEEPERRDESVDVNVNGDFSINDQTRQEAFDREVAPFAGSQARLGNELAQLPGPQIDFQGLMRVVITWAASLASSVALCLFVFRSFAAISGTEETHNELKRTIIKILVGMVLVLFSYTLVSFLMGIIWAGTGA